MAREKDKHNKGKRRGNGEGCITQRSDGRWQASFTVKYDPITRTSKKAYIYGKTREEVRDKLTDALHSVKNGTYRQPSKLTVGEWLTMWLNDYMKPSIRPTTWEGYQTQIDKHIIPNLGHIRLDKLQTSNLQKLYNDKLKGDRADGRKGSLSPRSVRYIHTILHAALVQAKREMLITINPADAVKLPKLEKREMHTLDTEGLKVFLEKAKKTCHYTIYLLACASGLRRGELLGLRWKDVDLDAGSITVTQNLVKTNKEVIFQEPKTKLSRRTVNIPPAVVKELRAHKARQAGDKLLHGDKYSKLGLVFCKADGSPMNPQTLSKHFDKLIKKTKLNRMCLHDLRHTFATLSLQEGVSPRTIQETLGHHNTAFTLNVYSHVTDKMRQEATDKIGNLLASCMGE